MYVSSGLPWFVTVVPKPRMGGMTDPQPGQQVDELPRMVAEMVGTQWEQVVASRCLQEELRHRTQSHVEAMENLAALAWSAPPPLPPLPPLRSPTVLVWSWFGCCQCVQLRPGKLQLCVRVTVNSNRESIKNAEKRMDAYGSGSAVVCYRIS